MELIDNCIQVKYLGRYSERNSEAMVGKDNYSIVKYPYDYYEMSLNIDGQDVIAILVSKKEYFEIKDGPFRTPDWDNPHKVLELYYILDEEKKEVYKEFKKSLETDTEIGKSEEFVNFNIAEATINLNVPYNHQKNIDKSNISKKVIEKLYEMKKGTLVNARKKGFNERREILEEQQPQYKLSNILSQLDEEKQQKAQRLYDKMMQCVLTGKYTFDNYKEFIRNLDRVCSGQAAFMPNCVCDAIDNYKDYSSTFFPYSRHRIANSIKEMYDIRYSGTRNCRFRTVEITPLTDEQKVNTSFNSAVPLGRIEQSGKGMDVYNKMHRLYRDNSDLEYYGDILIFEDTDGDFIFMTTERMKHLQREREISIEKIARRTEDVDIADKNKIEGILNEQENYIEGENGEKND